MNTKSVPSAQAEAQAVVSVVLWRPMVSAPVGDVTACIDIWSGEEDRRFTNCYWDAPEDEAEPCWIYEDIDPDGYSWGLVTRRVPDPIAWMPTPAKPEARDG